MKAKFLLLLLLPFALGAIAQQELDPVPQPVPEKKPATRSGKAPRNNADPFLRAGQNPAENQPPPKPHVIYGLIEYIEVPSDAWLAYSSANSVGGDASALRAEVQGWIAAGKAKPIELTCAATSSGQRMVVESTIERRFPSAFVMTPPTPVPTEFETRTTHFSFEWEPILGPDFRTVDSSFACQIARLAGSTFNTPLQRKFAQPGDLGQPLFATHKTTMSIMAPANQPVLLDAAIPFNDNGRPRDDVRWLLFFRSAPVPLTLAETGFRKPDGSVDIVEIGDGKSHVKETLSKKQVDDLLSSSSEDPKDVRLREVLRSLVESREKNPFGNRPFMFEIERLEVTLADLNAWFAGKDLEAGTNGLRKSALEWIRAGRGREVDRRIGPVRSGQRQLWESNFEVRYPSKYGTDPLIAPVKFDTRKTGYYVEMEPVISQDGKTVDLSIIPSDVRNCGNVVMHRSEVDGHMAPDVEQPVFATMKVTTSIDVALGQYSLLGITTPAGDNMEPDPQRRILTFVACRQ